MLISSILCIYYHLSSNSYTPFPQCYGLFIDEEYQWQMNPNSPHAGGLELRFYCLPFTEMPTHYIEPATNQSPKQTLSLSKQTILQSDINLTTRGGPGLFLAALELPSKESVHSTHIPVSHTHLHTCVMFVDV
jgi:hypothetical protein